MHEGTTIGIYSPLLTNVLYNWNKVTLMGKIGCTLSALCSSDTSRGGNIMRQFWESSDWVATMPPRMVHALLSSATWHQFLSVHRQQCDSGAYP